MTTVLVIFAWVYLGMRLGGLPFLQLDRTGIALLGTIALLVSHAITMEDAGRAIHMPTLILLFSFMVVAAQLRLDGFYDWITEPLTSARRVCWAGSGMRWWGVGVPVTLLTLGISAVYLLV